MSDITADTTPAFLDEELLSQPDPSSAPVPPEGYVPAGQGSGMEQRYNPALEQHDVPHMVPLATVLDTREKLREAQSQRDELQRQLEAYERQVQEAQLAAQTPPLPDYATDPDGYTAALMAQVEQTVQHRLLTHNLASTQERHGPEFERAYQAIVESGNPGLAQHILAQPDPGEAMVRWYRRSQVLAQIPDDDIDGWVMRRYAELAAQAAQQAPGGMPGARHFHQTPMPPPSLASAPGSANPFRDNVPDSAFAYAFGG